MKVSFLETHVERLSSHTAKVTAKIEPQKCECIILYINRRVENRNRDRLILVELPKDANERQVYRK